MNYGNPDDILKWSNLKVGIDKIEAKDIKWDSPGKFYYNIIHAAFKLYGKNPHTFCMKNTTYEMIKKHKKQLGFHEPPRVESAGII